MDDTDELVALLCTHVGMIMEDASVVALTVGARFSSERTDAIDKLHKATRIAAHIMEAVKVVG
jgi:hypothetical protein